MPINEQTWWPLRVGSQIKNATRADGQKMVALVASHPKGGGQNVAECLERDAGLLAAAYNSFDKAGRTLGLDAKLLAEKTDIADLVSVLTAFTAAHEKTPLADRFHSEPAYLDAKTYLERIWGK